MGYLRLSSKVVISIFRRLEKSYLLEILGEGKSMRKLIVLSFITLDNVMQSPGGPEEDPAGGIEYEGWVVGYFDDFLLNMMIKQTSKPFDLCLAEKRTRYLQRIGHT